MLEKSSSASRGEKLLPFEEILKKSQNAKNENYESITNILESLNRSLFRRLPTLKKY